ncbi:hsp90 co-chaperone Cdc37-like [Oppia nitens]|uniref:hsp90 co-chaperone Cdc37-like n=1 Tax=Oppia nitens TaxID=1686743 RepID=UPI0023D97A29|nr:hsp90 co-chaperone Cdc37-like [Oppia nitens]
MVDYSKWRTIEISDDEDDTHPNIDTPSLFRWRHQARVERMSEMEASKKALKDKRNDLHNKLKEAKQKAKQNDNNESKEEMKKLEEELAKLDKEQEELDQKEKLLPWNVDTISKEGCNKTVINKPKPRADRSNLSEEEQEKFYKEFIKKNEEKLKHFGMLGKPEDCKRYLMENHDLVCEETANYLALWCLNLEIEDKHDLMEFVAKQVVSMQYILELAKQLDVDPRGCVSSFFARIDKADKEYKDAFEDELRAFKERIRERARIRVEQAMKEVEEEERKKRIASSPGGLDPEDVFNSLPESLQKCFESRDIQLLQKTIAEMPEEEARLHMKRCIDSGLWVPDANSKELLLGGEIESEDNSEGIYSELKSN